MKEYTQGNPLFETVMHLPKSSYKKIGYFMLKMYRMKFQLCFKMSQQRILTEVP